MKKTFILVIYIFMFKMIFSADVALGIKYFGLSIHPVGVKNPTLMPYKLDSQAYLVLNEGITLNTEYYLIEDALSIKFVQGIYADCTTSFAGFTHIGFRGTLFKYKNHSINGGIGPTLVYRKNWYRLSGYDNELSFFRGGKTDEWQWNFLWYGGEFEYNYALSDSTELSISLIPGFPDLVSLSMGFKIKM